MEIYTKMMTILERLCIRSFHNGLFLTKRKKKRSARLFCLFFPPPLFFFLPFSPLQHLQVLMYFPGNNSLFVSYHKSAPCSRVNSHFSAENKGKNRETCRFRLISVQKAVCYSMHFHKNINRVPVIFFTAS